MAIGPDGTQGRGIGAPMIRSVACDGYSVKVGIDAPEHLFFRDFMHVSLTNRFPSRDWEVEIKGGNTNNGDMARYQAALAVYQDAIKVAEKLWMVASNHASMFEGYDDDVLFPVATSFPDYMLAAFLTVHETGAFAYMRGSEPAEDADPQIYGLDRLRERAVEVVTAKHEVG